SMPVRSEKDLLKKKEKVKELVIVSGALKKTRLAAERYMDMARREIEHVAPSVFKDGLFRLSEHITNRLPPEGKEEQ
ncbi:MAG: hypothetical protein HQL28_05705, partial [Candidatus Omnitrophica bacterium]|nr:hypothetical protein [Candidatus Omnitrophota bacterium]